MQSTTTHHPSLAFSGFGNSINITTQPSNNTWSAPVTTATTPTGGGGPPTPLPLPSFQLPQTQQNPQHAGVFSASAPHVGGGLNFGAGLNTAHVYNATNASNNLTFAVPGATAGVVPGAAAAAPQLAAYQPVYSDQVARAQAQMQIFRMLAPPPTPVYEECLVGIDGAYQGYCRQVINNEINVAALRMLAHVKAAQLTDPPAVTRLIGKRYFCSLKEVSKVVAASRMLLIAPDVRPSITAHIKPVRLLQMVMAAADAAGVPYVFCLSRRGIGQVFGRDKSMSIVAVMHVDGVENEYVTLLEQASQGRELYATHRGGRQSPINNNYTTFNTAAPLGGAGVGTGGGRTSPLGSGLSGGYYNPEFNYYGNQQNHHSYHQQPHQYDNSSFMNPQPQFPKYNQHGGYNGGIY
jgi:ribosomal protein L7Ae-like RNA K-turn-binding protein